MWLESRVQVTLGEKGRLVARPGWGPAFISKPGTFDPNPFLHTLIHHPSFLRASSQWGLNWFPRCELPFPTRPPGFSHHSLLECHLPSPFCRIIIL